MNTALKKMPKILCFYIGGLVLALLWALGLLVYDALTMPTPKQLTAADFEWYSLAEGENGSLVSTDGDPQMILRAGDIRTLSYTLIEGGSGSVCAYYNTQQGQDFSNRRRLWPKYGVTDRAFYVLPRTGAAELRLDITSKPGETLRFESITLNARPAWQSYFIPSTVGVFAFLTLPGFFWAGCMLCRDLFRHYVGKERDF